MLVRTGPLTRGDRLGRYDVLRRIATGGMAELYVARTVGADGGDKLVLLKRLLPRHASNACIVEMFIDEVRLAASLQHPNVARVHDVEVDRGDYFFTMEYVACEHPARAAGGPEDLAISVDALTVMAGLWTERHIAHALDENDRYAELDAEVLAAGSGPQRVPTTPPVVTIPPKAAACGARRRAARPSRASSTLRLPRPRPGRFAPSRATPQRATIPPIARAATKPLPRVTPPAPVEAVPLQVRPVTAIEEVPARAPIRRRIVLAAVPVAAACLVGFLAWSSPDPRAGRDASPPPTSAVEAPPARPSVAPPSAASPVSSPAADPGVATTTTATTTTSATITAERAGKRRRARATRTRPTRTQATPRSWNDDSPFMPVRMADGVRH